MENGKLLLQTLRHPVFIGEIVDGGELSPTSGGMQQGQARTLRGE